MNDPIRDRIETAIWALVFVLVFISALFLLRHFGMDF